MKLRPFLQNLADSCRESKRGLSLLIKNPLTFLGLTIVLLLFLVALFAPSIAPFPEQGMGNSNLQERLEPPSMQHILGTDQLGRDILSRLIMGSRVSLKAGVVVILFVTIIGTPLGLIAGYYGGLIDNCIMRLSDLFLAFPPLLLAIAIVAALGPNLMNAMLALSIPWWPWYARLIRGQVLSLKEMEFVEAAKSLGTSDLRIMFRHILPNSLSPIIVQATMDMGYIILSLASLGFLGLGTQPPTPDWGVMVSNGREFFMDEWWLSTFSGAAIFLTVFAFNLVGDGLREAMDPKIRWKFKGK